MPFIGNQPALSYTSFAKQDFTTSATTSYTLDQPVANANELALFINFVRQEPTTAYTASGTTLTLTSATSASDDMYCVFLGKAVQTVNPPNSSVGTSQLADSSVTNAKIASSIINSQTAETSIAGGDEVLIYDTSASALRKMTRTNFVSGIGGTNTPNFWVYRNTNQTVPTSTFTTVQFNAELFDTANAFNTSTYTYTIPSTGKYFFGVQVRKENSRTDRNLVHFKVNGTQTRDFETGSYSNYGAVIGTTIENLSVNDAITIQFYHDRGSNQDIRGSGSDSTFFYGYKIIE